MVLEHGRVRAVIFSHAEDLILRQKRHVSGSFGLGLLHADNVGLSVAQHCDISIAPVAPEGVSGITFTIPHIGRHDFYDSPAAVWKCGYFGLRFFGFCFRAHHCQKSHSYYKCLFHNQLYLIAK